MTWAKVARKDFSDAVQSRALWALVAVFVVVSAISAYAYTAAPQAFGEPEGATFNGLVLFTVGLLGLFVPIAAIVVCYKSLAGERESGSVKLLLAQPTTRTDVLLGKFVGRAAVLFAGLGSGLVIGLVVGAVLVGQVDAVAALAVVVLTLVFVIAYASIMVSASALTGSTAKATTLALGFFVIVEVLWDAVPMGILFVLEGFALPSEIPDWAAALMQVPPSAAYLSAVVAAVPDFVAGQVQGGGGVGVSAGESILAAPEIGYVVLAFWIVVPLLIARDRFRRADI